MFFVIGGHRRGARETLGQDHGALPLYSWSVWRPVLLYASVSAEPSFIVSLIVCFHHFNLLLVWLCFYSIVMSSSPFIIVLTVPKKNQTNPYTENVLWSCCCFFFKPVLVYLSMQD